MHSPPDQKRPRHEQTRRRHPARRHPGLFLKCLILVAVIRVVLKIRSYKPIVDHIRALEPGTGHKRPPLLYVWAVERAARFVPGATCLTQALAVKWLMQRSGQDCTVRIGVENKTTSRLRAHAWVTYRDIVIIGGDSEDIGAFTPIATIG